MQMARSHRIAAYGNNPEGGGGPRPPPHPGFRRPRKNGWFSRRKCACDGSEQDPTGSQRLREEQHATNVKKQGMGRGVRVQNRTGDTLQGEYRQLTGWI